jgi:uncharacterized protein (DUF58 family)
MAKEPNHSELSGVYANLQDLIKLQYKASGFSFLPKQPVHSLLSGRHTSRLRGRGLDFEEIRHYLPGDDIRNMDWKVTARTRKPHTRVYTEERERPVLLVVDQRISMFFGSTIRMKSVTAAESAALGAWRVVSVGDRVGAVVFNDRNLQEIKPQRSKKTVMQILQMVVEYNHALHVEPGFQTNPGMLNQVLKKVVNFVNHDYLITIISDFEGANAETKELMTQLAHHNDVLVLLIYDQLESHLPEAGKLVMSDGELQVEVDSGNSRLRTQFHAEFDERLKLAQDILQKRGVPVLPIHTAEGVAEQVRHLLGYSPRTRRG